MNDTATQPTDDAFLGGRLLVRQPARGYRAGLDAVMLAAAVPLDVGASTTVLDMGAGVGTVGLAIATRVAATRVVLLERDAALAALARVNITGNGLAARVRLVEADIGAASQHLTDAGLYPDSIDHAVANPPYFTEGHGTTPAHPHRAMSRQMPENGTEIWLRAAARAVRPGGTLTLIHRAEALGRLLAALDGRFGGVQIKPIVAVSGDAASRILLHAEKGSRAPLRLLSPLVTHTDGGFTPAVAAVVTQPAALACFF